MYDERLKLIAKIMYNARGSIFQKDLIDILKNRLDERQTRRYIYKLKDLEYITIDNVDNKNVLYLTNKAYKEMFKEYKRVSKTINNNRLEANFLNAYILDVYGANESNLIWKKLYKKRLDSARYTNTVQLINSYKNNVIITPLIFEDNSLDVDVVIFKHKHNIKKLIDIIAEINLMIEMNFIMYDLKSIDIIICSCQDINLELVRKKLSNYYDKNKNDLSEILVFRKENLKDGCI